MRCPSCKTPVETEANYCPSCGTLLTRAGRYGVELREVACLAVDIQGLAKLLGQISTAEVSEYVAECMAALEETCTAYGGTVITRHSAGLAAVFGAPVTREREVELAVRAAFAARERISEISARLTASHGQSLSSRYAVDYGLVRVGARAAAADYVALGAPVEEVARLRNNARPNTVLLSRAAANQVRALFRLRPVALGTTTRDGRAESGYLAEEMLDSPAAASHLRRPFVGREAEVAQLREAVAALRQGRGGVVAIAGEPGIGKTRLVWEALGEEEGVRVYAGRCMPLTTEISFAAFVSPLLAALELAPGATPRGRAEAVIGERRPDLREAVPILAAVVERRTPETPLTEQLTGVARFEKLFELFEAVWAYAAAKYPTVLVVEDAQWASNADFLLLTRFASRVDDLPLLLIVTARDPEVLRRVTPEVTSLPPLPADDLETLARELIPREKATPDLIRRLVEWAEGNPLYCEEVAASVVAGSADNGFQPPASLKAAARARADLLSSEALAVAKTAACVGLEAELALLREVVPAPSAANLESVAEELEGAGVARMAGGRLLFNSDVVREVLYESLVKKERAVKLADIARAAEARGAEPGVVAHYLLAAGRSREAVEHLKEAGDRAAGSYALAEAITHYERAFENLRRVAPTDVGLKLELVEKLADALLEYAEPRRALGLIEEELRYAETPPVRAKLLFLAGRAYNFLSDYRKSLLFLEDARSIYQSLNDALMEGQTLRAAAKAYLFLGDREARQNAIAGALARFTEAGDDVGVGYCYNNIGADYQNADEPTKGIEYFQEALYIWQQSGYLPGQAMALTNLSVGYYLLGRNREAVDFAERAEEMTRRIGTRRVQAAAAANLAAFLRYLDPARAVEYGQEAAALAEDIENYEALTASHVNLGELARYQGRWDAAREHVAAAQKAAAQMRAAHVGFEAELLGAKIELDAGEYDSDQFRRHYEAVYRIEPPFRETAALARANLEAALTLAREDRGRAAAVAAELNGRLAAAKKADEVYEGRIWLGEVKLLTGKPTAAAAEFEWVMGQTDGVNVVHWPWAAFGLARAQLASGRREEAARNLAAAEEMFFEYGWMYWTDRVAQFRAESAL
ncbi:MAG: AAA family ATPase [Candidatus Coatesbacteria bacterium]|nr:MAG: AAA family ATPase [Candidatus Coatesbacteria bacterium]